MPVIVSDQERARRVREEGSRRKRDLAGLQRIEALEASERQATATDPRAAAVTQEMLARCALAVPDSTFAIWLAPLRCAGGDGTTLFLASPDAAWVQRRYLSLIQQALQGTGYADVQFVSGREE